MIRALSGMALKPVRFAYCTDQRCGLRAAQSTETGCSSCENGFTRHAKPVSGGAADLAPHIRLYTNLYTFACPERTTSR
eukprot:1532501-Pleurochrysis_carterae.AAC.1